MRALTAPPAISRRQEENVTVSTEIEAARPFTAAEAQRVLTAIDPGETTAFLRRLVQVPSVNPPGETADAIAVCEAPLRDAGYAIRRESHAPGKPSLIAEFGPADGPTLLFNAHVDVVPTAELAAWTHPPFAAEIVGNRVYGRGAGDDKASVTAQVMAGVALARSGVPLRGRLTVTEVADEETGGGGAQAVVARLGYRPDWAIVGEQTLNRVALGEKGAAGLTIRLTGRAAHGALPWEGANAIEAMARVIVALKDELGPRLATRTHPYFQPSSASVNLVSGGVKHNVVADRCEIFVDRRIVPGEDPATTVEEMLDVARRAVADLPGIGIEAEPRWLGAATMSDPDAPAVRAMLAANAYLGMSTELTGFSMGTDGRFFAAAGWPTIIYGPGDPRLAHVPDEWVGLDEVLAATRAYALTALALLKET
jgi:succinyl-diaminopimelate desuccinylase